MRVLVFGAGAIGQWIAARFSAAGADVTVLCRRAAYEAITARGLRVRVVDGVLEAPSVRAVERLDDLRGQTFDWVLVTVKTFDVAQAMQDLAAAGLLDGAQVMGFQNGVGTEETIAGAVPPQRSFVCVVTRPIALTEQPGEVSEATTRGGLAVSPYVAGTPFGALEPVLAGCGLEVSRLDDQRVMKWSKLLLNMTANATCAILDCTPAELYASRKLFGVEHAAFSEAAQVMRALHVKPANLPGYPAARLSFLMGSVPRRVARYVLNYSVGAARGSKQPSLRLEMERPRGGRADSEVDWLNGAVVTFGARLGIATPANAFLTHTLKEIVGGRLPWDTYRHEATRFVADFKAALHG